MRSNIAAGHTVTLSAPKYVALSSPVARRLYRLIEAHRAGSDTTEWSLSLERLAESLPLTQRYPSHLQRVLQPAHEMLLAGGIIRKAQVTQDGRLWHVAYRW
jgi:plasmid replication initiation protein